MYNGIGLTTARGSGTNGYVQTNKFFLKPRVGRVAAGTSKGFDPKQGTAGLTRKPNKEILEHDRKRQIELKLVVLEDKLIDQGFTDAEVAERLAEARRTLEAFAADESGALVGDKKVSDTQTHQIAARKERQMETLREAFGIRSAEQEEPNIEEEPTNNPRSGANKHKKSEHSFLDRDYGGRRSVEENQKSENEDKKKGAKESKRSKKEKSKKRRHQDDSSDTDIEKKRTISKKRRKNKRDASDDSESDSSTGDDSDSESDSDSASSYDSSDSDGSPRRRKAVKKTDKKHKDAQRHRKSRNVDSDSSSDGEDRKQFTKKKVEKHQSSNRRHDKDDSSSDEESLSKERPGKRTGGRNVSRDSDSHSDDNTRKQITKMKAENPKRSNRRHGTDDSSSEEGGLLKGKLHKRTGGRRDSEDDSETDVGAKKTGIRLEESRRQNYVKPESKATKAMQQSRTDRKHDSENESDPEVEMKQHNGGNNKSRRKPDIDSESEGEQSRKPESRRIERSQRIGKDDRRYDNSGPIIDEKTEKRRDKRHDSDEEPAKRTSPVKRGLVSSDAGDVYRVKNNQFELGSDAREHEYKRGEKNNPGGDRKIAERDDVNRKGGRSPPEDFRPRSVVTNERKKETRDSDDDRYNADKDSRSGRYGQPDERGNDRRDASYGSRSGRDHEQHGDDRWRMSYEDEHRGRKHGRDNKDDHRGNRSHGRDSDQNRERDYGKRAKYDDSRASERNRRGGERESGDRVRR